MTLEELEYHEAEKLRERSGLGEADAGRRASHLIQRMRTAFSDAEITDFERLEGTYGLPDPNDEHIVAAAEVAGAGAIVSDNIKDFPRDKVPARLEILRPAEFAESTVSIDPIRARAAVVARTGAKGPRLVEDDFLDILSLRYGMSATVDLIRQAR